MATDHIPTPVRPGSTPARAAQSLTGRLHVIELLPFSQGELDGVRETFLTDVMADPSSIASGLQSQTTRGWGLGGRLPRGELMVHLWGGSRSVEKHEEQVGNDG